MKVKFYFVALLLVFGLIFPIKLFSQIQNSDMEKIVLALIDYNDCKSLCINSKLIDMDTQVFNMVNRFYVNRRRFKKLITNRLDSTIPNLSRLTDDIINYESDSNWNRIYNGIIRKKQYSECDLYTSIMKPFQINENEILVIASNFSIDKLKDDYYSLVYFYALKFVETEWKVEDVDFVYEITYNWN